MLRTVALRAKVSALRLAAMTTFVDSKKYRGEIQTKLIIPDKSDLNTPNFTESNVSTVANFLILPFVNREFAMSEGFRVLVNNLNFSDLPAIRGGQDKGWTLVVAGTNQGSGKSEAGMELSKMMSEYVAQERNKKLIAVAVENSASLTSVRELYDHIASSDEMKGLKEALSSANDPNDPIELAHLTNKFLESRDSVLFLQLDEFAVEFMTPEFLAAGISSAAKSLSLSATLPTDIRTSVLSAQCSTSQQAMQSSTPSPSSRPSNLQLFCGLWTNVLTPIVKSSQMVLYVCGKSPLFDQLGTGCGGMASPTGVLQLPLDLLDRKYIRKVLDSISVYQENGVEPMPLSEVFRRILKDTPGGRTPLKSVDPLCELIHKVSGGVPRYVHHVIVEMLKMDEIRRVMFDVESFVPLGKLKGKGKSMVH
jgi:hypothetical protein